MKDINDASMSETNTHILDSHLVKTKAEMRDYLQRLRDLGVTQMAVCQRDVESMVREWRSHNFFYNLHVFRSRTGDVDLELKQTWWREWFCRLVNWLYFWDKD